MNTDTKIFFKVPLANSEFALYPATIAEVNDDIYTAQLDDYKADGFESKADMLNGLKNFYPHLDFDSDVTVVKWEDI